MADSKEPVFNVQRIYLKDASLEQPNSPGILPEFMSGQEQPALEIQLRVGAQAVQEGIFEALVTVTVQCKLKEKTVYLAEATQAGIFEIRNLPDDQMAQILNILCPQIVYPYLRSNVADIIQRTGMPPVHLVEVNFQHMYEQQQAQAQAQAQPQNQH